MSLTRPSTLWRYTARTLRRRPGHTVLTLLDAASPADGTYTLYTSTQVPHLVRTLLPGMIGVNENKIRVVAPEVGGGFGSKLQVYAEEALACVEHHCPDAIIADFKLPGMTGEALVRTVKSIHPEIPIVLISGYVPSLTGRELADGAADAYLMKPFRIDRIGEILKSLSNREP